MVNPFSQGKKTRRCISFQYNKINSIVQMIFILTVLLFSPVRAPNPSKSRWGHRCGGRMLARGESEGCEPRTLHSAQQQQQARAEPFSRPPICTQCGRLNNSPQIYPHLCPQNWECYHAWQAGMCRCDYESGKGR